ncbi:hypothetical protein, partial [Burkholderia glumae]|uniref:hypothetical protein n=1 Tax=Burkholderia glumae TaxID=337 RepID=UPI0019D71805
SRTVRRAPMPHQTKRSAPTHPVIDIRRNFLLIDRPVGIAPISISALAHSDSRLASHSSCHESEHRDLLCKTPRGQCRFARPLP